ncbi:MAG: hypothetical protein NVS2B9_12710 [Myxococcales bacterium]
MRLFACVLTLCLAAGCGDACLSLAKEICQCLPDDGTRGACNKRASDSETFFPVRANDQAYCQKQLDARACDCNNLATAEGKRNCGLSYPTQPTLTAAGSGTAARSP